VAADDRGAPARRRPPPPGHRAAPRRAAADRDGYERLLAGVDGLGLDALADLPEAQQQAIRARVVEDRGYAEIAAALGLSEPATRQQVSRGLAALRRTLGRGR
jgi:DNA-directed RNA polymerase specialized sigma24 family protein